MTYLVNTSNTIVRLLALVASLGVIAMMLHVCADIVLRSVFGWPIPATIEVASRYYMVAIAFLPLAWVERNEGMVSVEVFDGFLSPVALRFSDLLVSLLAFAIYCGLAYTTSMTALSNFKTGSFVLALSMRVPVWPTYFLPPLGFGLAAFAVLVRIGLLIDDRRDVEPESRP